MALDRESRKCNVDRSHNQSWQDCLYSPLNVLLHPIEPCNMNRESKLCVNHRLTVVQVSLEIHVDISRMHDGMLEPKMCFEYSL